MEIKEDNVEKLLKPLSSNQILRAALKMLFPRRKSKGRFIVVFALSIIPAYLMATSENTVSVYKEVVQLLTDITLSLFGVVFTGYALFQALIGKEMLVRMINASSLDNESEKSKLQESNELFVKTMMLQLICIAIGVVMSLILACMPCDYILFDNTILNEVIAGGGMFAHFFISLAALLEVKSFIFNIFQLFNFHAATRVMELLKESQDEHLS